MTLPVGQELQGTGGAYKFFLLVTPDSRCSRQMPCIFINEATAHDGLLHDRGYCEWTPPEVVRPGSCTTTQTESFVTLNDMR